VPPLTVSVASYVEPTVAAGRLDETARLELEVVVVTEVVPALAGTDMLEHPLNKSRDNRRVPTAAN
jgi:hypothetical protein